MKKLIISSLFVFISPFVLADDLVSVDMALVNYRQSSPPCGSYMQKDGAKDNGALDQLVLRNVRGWRTPKGELKLRVVLLPGKCVEVDQPEPEPPFRKGLQLDLAGVTPDPEDFVVALAGTWGRVVWDKPTRQYYGPYAQGRYQFDSLRDEYFVELQWKVKDLMGFFDFQKYKKGKEIEIQMPLAFCTRNVGVSSVRPPMDVTLYRNPEDPFSGVWTRLFDEQGRPQEPAYCLKLRNDLKATLNKSDMDNDSSMLPKPEGIFLKLLTEYDSGILPEASEILGWRSGRCFFRQDGSKEIPAMLVGRAGVYSDGVAKLQMQRWVDINQKADFYDHLSPKDFASSLKAADQYFSEGKGEAYASQDEYIIAETDFRKAYLRKTDQGLLLKVVDFYAGKAGTIQKEATRVCLFTKKFHD